MEYHETNTVTAFHDAPLLCMQVHKLKYLTYLLVIKIIFSQMWQLSFRHRAPYLWYRTVYSAVRAPRYPQQRLKQEIRDADAEINLIHRRESELRDFLEREDENKRLRELAEAYSAEPEKAATEQEIAVFDHEQASVDMKNRLPLIQSRQGQLPRSIMQKIGHNAGLALSPQGRNWEIIISCLENTGLIGTEASDIEKFVAQIPVSHRLFLARRLEKLTEGKQTQFLKDKLMEAYALESSYQVERILATCSQPTEYSFGHLAKALFRERQDPKVLANVIVRMKNAGLEPNLTVITTVVQSYIVVKQYDVAFKVFDNLKYASMETQPDTKLYNSMILVAAKEHNVNRALDLFNEMVSRPIDPLEPNEESYELLVYACARDPATHMKAWQLFMEMHERGIAASLKALHTLLYLCAKTGEVLICRALVRQMWAQGILDSFSLNCLFRSYGSTVPGRAMSPILETALGPKLRQHLLNQSTDGNHRGGLPLLPVMILDKERLLAESNALVEFLSENSPELIKRWQDKWSPTIYSYIRMALELGDLPEFKRRMSTYTSENEKKLTNPRSTEMLRLALLACAEFRDLPYAREIWEEHGRHRETLPAIQRKAADRLIARDIVRILAVCGHVKEALKVVEQTKKRQKWRRRHLQVLYDVCAEHHDFDSIAYMNCIVRQ